MFLVRLMTVKIHIIGTSLLILLAGCCAPGAFSQQTPVQRFRVLISNRQHHAAFRLWPQVEAEMKDVPEDAMGFEYCLLMGTTSSVGHKNWAAILMDPEISVELKHDLVDEIQETAEHGLYQGNASGDSSRPD